MSLVTYDSEEIQEALSTCTLTQTADLDLDLDHVVKLLKLVKRFNSLGHVHQASEILDIVLEYLEQKEVNNG